MKICFFKSTSGFKGNTYKYSKITYEKNYSCQAADLQILNTTCQPALPCCWQWKSVFSKAPVGLKGTRISTPKLHTKRITRVRQPICRFWIPPASLLFPVVVFVLFSFFVQLLLPTFDCFHSMLFFFIHLIFPYVFRITFPKLYIFALIKQKKVKFWSAHFFQFRSNRLLSFLRQCFTAFSHFSVFVLIHPHYILLTDISFLCLCFC